mmetsp:Transcript_48402/g.128176  ORF Transcript_48402/g.128176 Transcript_48402/m.128176 type:complete len:389 (-) Transcript_48402:123-1289(-)
MSAKSKKKAHSEAEPVLGYSQDLNVDTKMLDPKVRKRAQDSNEQWMTKGTGDRSARKEERQERLSNKAKAMMRETPPARSFKQMFLGITCFFLMCGVGLFQTLAPIVAYLMGTGAYDIDVADTPRLRDVLFSGDPWLVYCVNNETRKYRLPGILEEHTRELRSVADIKVAILGCWDPTESGRSVAQRFKLRESPPLSFFITNGENPKTVELGGVRDAESLVKKVRPLMAVKIAKIDTLKSWPQRCTDRRACVVVGHKDAEERDEAVEVIKPLLEKTRLVRLVTLDTAFWSLKLDKEVLQKRPRKQYGQADVLCLARKEAVSEDGMTHEVAFLQNTDSDSAVLAFLTGCARKGDLDFVTIPSTPSIKARPSKKKGREGGGSGDGDAEDL